jgi:hypothetical protein
MTSTTRPIADLWTEAEQIDRWIDEGRYTAAGGATVFEQSSCLVLEVLKGLITSKADAIAKLKAAGLSFARGHRCDELEGPAHVEAIRWLEAN